MLNKVDCTCTCFFDLFSVCLKTVDHLNLKLLIFSSILQVSEVQDFRNVELSPMHCIFVLIEPVFGFKVVKELTVHV